MFDLSQDNIDIYIWQYGSNADVMLMLLAQGLFEIG